MMVAEQEKKDAFLEAVYDEYKRRILVSTFEDAKSIDQISQENGIPISTCYRRVHELVNLQLLTVEQTIIADNGKKHETFRSAFKDARVILASGELAVELTPIPR